ncbi:MAG: hypothetical protein ACXVBV_10940, partial [Isosphaeraceae bacterium]
AAAENPTGRWLPKIRFELAAIELGGGNLPVAEELARSEAIRLLSDDRKDHLAEVYHAFARRLLEPDDPVIQPDPHAAWGLLSPGLTHHNSESGLYGKFRIPSKPRLLPYSLATFR